MTFVSGPQHKKKRKKKSRNSDVNSNLRAAPEDDADEDNAPEEDVFNLSRSRNSSSNSVKKIKKRDDDDDDIFGDLGEASEGERTDQKKPSSSSSSYYQDSSAKTLHDRRADSTSYFNDLPDLPSKSYSSSSQANRSSSSSASSSSSSSSNRSASARSSSGSIRTGSEITKKKSRDLDKLMASEQERQGKEAARRSQKQVDAYYEQEEAPSQYNFAIGDSDEEDDTQVLRRSYQQSMAGRLVGQDDEEAPNPLKKLGRKRKPLSAAKQAQMDANLEKARFEAEFKQVQEIIKRREEERGSKRGAKDVLKHPSKKTKMKL